ncbi:TonB-linked SusC/RagA family outer membrane protein [Parabacteroides sp. PF5-5]|uniref:SusC/RagA family TonB-linked outer membrane protein n=1 Tax=unclassified Parabacteroides TaxID=2649774 RepID=UPI0024747000|nr:MULTISPECIES: TonB-dependent receptor [unclassified Parabacteroides]MDH6304681.1 TonB-linked SusC/RagA family outer membrane protein [Parabacteroides sp. PH5-39]MDH6315705.1 TonB-linked SusC/RagA family outer membrane protein [Parabacteroides sp. PF5-13]MDH6319365.1 TonB-linked SusC/RagA family outer membrane protein [Parabacteroides sp. PH5-13]MDH6323096.1 TonB-linked SusC/RagA family outer membrane protein [Parabacteroides sp. PH5-8]MDH6326898.1 TonB-linked SusC/RagA family outer membrane
MKITNLKKSIGLLSLLLMIPVWVCAQNVTVKGTVKDSFGDGIPGVNVLQVGTTNGIITDIDGNYQINVPSNATLSFSFIGYITQTIPVAGKSTINVILNDDTQALDEVVVVGYGAMKKSDISGSVASVDREAMMRKTPINIAQGLQGAAAGVMVTSQDGSPEAKAAIRIRGVATINGTADPLYVVDGVQVGTNVNHLNPSDIESMEILKDASATAIYGSAGANGVIMITTKHGIKGRSTVNLTADFGIQTISSRMDVGSLDQYAANIRQAHINDASGLYNQIWDAKYDGKRKTIDWMDQMTNPALRQNYNLSTSGGNDKSQFNFSAGYLDNKGLIVNSQYQRITARANVKTKVNKYLEFGGDLSYVHTDSHGSNNTVGNFGNMSSFRDLETFSPTLDYVTAEGVHVSPNVENPDGTYGSAALGKNANEAVLDAYNNIYASQMNNRSRNRNNRVLASAYLDITFFEGLSFKTLASYNYSSGSHQNFVGSDNNRRFNSINGEMVEVTLNKLDYTNTFNLSNNEGQTLSISNYFTYNWKNDMHNVTLMAGNEVSRYYGQWVNAGAKSFPGDNIREVSLTSDISTLSANGALNLESRAISYFARASYSLMDRYILTGTIRRDGSSNFGAGNRWGTFPSAAAAWRISEEAFMQDQDIFSNLKLRVGWGQTGNSGGATDLSVAALTLAGIKYNFYSQNGNMGLGSTPSATGGTYQGLVDSNLKWETNEQTNIGLDFGLLQGELNITADYFIRKSKDLLLYRQVRPSTGYQQVYTNYGEIENKGFEMSISYNKRLNKDWSINATLTGSTLKNKIKKMGEPVYYTNSDASGKGTDDGSNTGAVGAAAGYHWGNHSVSKEGAAVGSFYGYRVEGVFKNQAEVDAANAATNGSNSGYYQNDKTQAGDYKFKDLDGNGFIDENDMEVLGDGFPDLNFGLNLGATYKNWDFSLYTYGVLGQDIFSYSAMRLSNMFTADDPTPNILREAAKNAWSPENTNGSLSRLSLLDANYNMRASDMWVKNGNFLKISNIQVGYTLPKSIASKLLIENVRLYLSVANLATISPYNKYGDPEVGQGSVLVTGLDTGRYPSPRTYSFGLNVQF